MVSARRCLSCKVLFESIDALNDHCALTSTHPLKTYRCLPCDRAFTTPSGLQSHLGSVVHENRSRAQISAQRSQVTTSHDHDGATQPVPDMTLTTNNVEDQSQTYCRRCKLTFGSHELLFEHYRTSSLHYDCRICFQVFPKKKALKKHMAEYHSQALVLPTPEDHQTQITIPVPPASVSLPAVFPTGTETTPQPELLEDDDFVLVEKSSLLLRTPETPTPVTENANATLPSNGFFKCPGCHTHFHSFSTFVIHIDNGTCSSASMSRQINNEINAFAVQLFRNFSVVSG